MQYLESIIKQSRIITSNDVRWSVKYGEDTGSESDIEDDDGLDQRASRLVRDLGFQIRCFMDLVPTIELNLALAGIVRRRRPHTVERSFCASEPAKIYISLVRDKIRGVDHRLVDRLGEANWQRQANIREKMDVKLLNRNPIR